MIRVDRRFIVPNNAHGPGDYSRGTGGADLERVKTSQSTRLARMVSVLSEEEVFDDQPVDPLMRSVTRRTGGIDEELAMGGETDLEREKSKEIDPERR